MALKLLRRRRHIPSAGFKGSARIERRAHHAALNRAAGILFPFRGAGSAYGALSSIKGAKNSATTVMPLLSAALYPG
ncbi:MAG: hypothetical protein IJ209_04065 [Bacteroidaceae bacterium]|nr:hypothetical protein [Bacteroidaceae bacterium]